MGAMNYKYPKIVKWLGCIGISTGGYFAIQLFNHVNKNGAVEYFFGNWPAPIGIAYNVDHLNALMILMIYTISF